ncbi:MAG TPA: DUF4860 domain-containing protein [Lachnospiraceae bacterium]|nr:DUF4860 domain-containing protein [Lachnospiraceae bacterium]
MNFSKREKSIVDILFLLALFCVFLVSALFIVLFGAKIYRSTVADMNTNFTSRTALSYITEKMRQHDSAGGAQVTFIDGQPVLCLNQENDGVKYCTYLFSNDGYLKEVTAKENYDFDLSSGQNIIELSEFTAEEIQDSLYKFHITDIDGNQIDFYVSLYSHTNEGETPDE